MQLKEKLELLFERLKDHEEEQRVYALTELKKEVSGATSSMTSVPKPLKFLVKHYPGLKEIYHAIPSSVYKVRNQRNYPLLLMLTKYLIAAID